MDYFEDIAQAVQFMEAHLQEPIAVADVAKPLGLSNWHFQRIFREYVGTTIGSYLRRRRLACALDELRAGSRKVIDIALDYQFGSPEAFSRSFKQEFGLSPQQLRSSGAKLAPYRMPSLDRKQLHYVLNELELSPTFREIDPILVVGLPVSFISPLAERAKYMETIPQIWKQFVSRESEISARIGAIKVGVIEGMATPRHHIHEDLMDYLAATPVSEASAIPNGLQSFEIPGGMYAVFRATGYHEQTQYIIDHVYSTWLPEAEYQRREGPEFTWLDHRVHPLDPLTSEVEYFLPVRPKR